jgi:hypothetical protein
MSGEVQARGSKLKNRNKKRAMMHELEKQEYFEEKIITHSAEEDNATSSKNVRIIAYNNSLDHSREITCPKIRGQP